MRNKFDEIRNNQWKSWLLIAIFMALAGIMGLVVGFFWGNIYLGVGLTSVSAIIYTLIVFKEGDKMILGLTKAKEVKKQDYPHLFHTVEGLSLAAGIKTPKCYVIEDDALNAFATGKTPEKASIVITTGLLNKLNREELEGVVAHEMSHIKNNDIKTMMLAAVLVGIIVLLSDIMLRSFLWGAIGGHKKNNQGTIIMIVIGLALAILAPLIAQLIKLAISRKREYMADASGAVLTRYPLGLAHALEKIKADPDPLVDTANRATAHLFISTPFRKKKGIFTKMFSTHPDINDRIKRLKEM